MSAILTADAVGKVYGARAVLSSATLAVEPGVVTLLAGRNGAGKSTLLKIAAGVIAPDHGTVRFRGRTLERAHLHRLAREGVFHLPDGPILSPALPLRVHLDAIVKRFGGAGGNAEGVAERMGIAPLLDALPGSFSGGEWRRAGVAAALLRAPACLLADEPLRGVAPLDAESVLAALRELAARGCGVVITGHELPLLLPGADRVVWVTAGTSYDLGATAQAERDPRFRRDFLGLEEIAAADAPQPSIRTASPPLGAKPPVPRHDPTSASAPAPEAGSAPASPASMQIDAQTLKDLEVFEAPGGATSLFQLLDRTRTLGGRSRLRKRFQKPFADAASILDTQFSVEFAARNPGLFAEMPDEERLRELDAYLHAHHAPVHARSDAWLAARALWARMRDPRMFEAVENGVEAATSLLRAVRAVAVGLRERGAPGPLGRIAARLDELTGSEEMEVLELDRGTRALRIWEVFARDRALRERLRAPVEAVVEQLHELDALVSMATATRALGFALPRIHPESDAVLEIRGARHPFVQRPVPNDFALEGGRTLLFLTGPNMAGTTTYMRACALCVFLAQLGMGAPAAEMELSPFATLLMSLNTADNTRLGYSFFFSEVRRVRDAAQRLETGRRSLVLFDEMFKGTNVRDAYDGSLGVVTAFAAVAGSVVVVSSHLVELVEELRHVPTIQLRYFDATVREGGELAYDFRLKDGHSAQRLGLVLLEREGLTAMLDRLRSGGTKS